MLRNRIVMTAVDRSLADEDGEVTDAMLDHYTKILAAGPCGLCITEHAYVRRDGLTHSSQLAASDDGCIEGLSRLAECCHATETPVLLRLSHAGSMADPTEVPEPVAPSPVFNPFFPSAGRTLPHELTELEIERLIIRFLNAAVRAKKAGFDGVELHCGHGYLLNEFYSPLTNKRVDQFGPASIMSRMRALLETVYYIRSVIGSDFIVSVCLGASDYAFGGSTIEDAAEAARSLHGAGVDVICVSGGLRGNSRPDTDQAGWFSDASTAVREQSSVPVILKGGIRTAADARRLLGDGACDLVGVGRTLERHLDWANKALVEE